MTLLFLSHETSRTGAPLVLLHFLRWLRKNQPHIDFDVLTLQTGALQTAFEQEANTFYNINVSIYEPPKFSRWQRIYFRFFPKKRPIPISPRKFLMQALAKANYNLIYANTVVCLPTAVEIKDTSNEVSRLVLHVHEAKIITEIMAPQIEKYLPKVDHFIAVSDIVVQNLIRLGVHENKITKIYECTEVEKDNTIKKEENEHKKNTFIVGSSGNVHWRKGDDVFLQLAFYIKKHYPDAQIHFSWVGYVSAQQQSILENDIVRMGLAEMVTFEGEQENPFPFYQNFDVFVTPSREDPFPLVCIEVGMLGKPIICFEGAIGTEEFLREGGGYIVPYLDVEAMAKKIMYYYNNPSIAKNDGATNVARFSQFTPDIICPKLFEVVKTNASTDL